jgi:hypothetical protein
VKALLLTLAVVAVAVLWFHWMGPAWLEWVKDSQPKDD